MLAPRGHRITTSILLLAVVTFLVFSSCLHGPELFDDAESIGLNPTITTLWPLSVPLHPPNQTSMAGRPVTNFTLALNYGFNSLLGLDQQAGAASTDYLIGYHALSILMHIVGGLLLFGVIRRTLASGRFGERWVVRADTVALLVAAVWMLHPLQTAAVSYISQRTEVLVSMFYLATLYASIRAWDAPEGVRRRCWYAVGVVACLLGMGSKEVMVSAPLMVVLYDRAFRVESWRELLSPAMRSRRWFYAGLFGTLAVLYMLMAAGSRAAAVGFHAGMPWDGYLWSQGREIPHYLSLIVLPISLTLDYGKHVVPFWRAAPGFMLLSALGAATVWAWSRVARWGWLAFCGAWFFCLLAPSSSFVPNAAEIGADRRVYLASAAVLMVMVVLGDAIVRWFADRPSGPSIRMPSIGRGATYAFLGAMSLFTFRRSGLYADPVAIWKDAIRKVPENARAYNNLGVVLGTLPTPRVAEALASLREAIRRDSGLAMAWGNLGDYELELGDTVAAIPILRQYGKLVPWDQVAAAKLARLTAGPGETAPNAAPGARSADSLSQVAQLLRLGEAHLSAGRMLPAQDAFRRAIQADSTRLEAYQVLGGLLMDDGRANQAVPLLQRAVKQDPGSAITLALLSLAYAKAGNATNAIDAAQRAVMLGQPGPPVFYFAGSAMAEVKRLDQADAYLTRAVELAPTYSDALSELGLVKEQEGKRAEAADLYRRALAVNALDARAKSGLQRIGGQ